MNEMLSEALRSDIRQMPAELPALADDRLKALAEGRPARPRKGSLWEYHEGGEHAGTLVIVYIYNEREGGIVAGSVFSLYEDQVFHRNWTARIPSAEVPQEAYDDDNDLVGVYSFTPPYSNGSPIEQFGRLVREIIAEEASA